MSTVQPFQKLRTTGTPGTQRTAAGRPGWVHPSWKGGSLLLIGVIWLLTPMWGAGQAPAPSPRPGEVRGEPIRRPSPSRAGGSNAGPSQLANAVNRTNTGPDDATLNAPDGKEGEFIRLSFAKLSAFPYEVYEVASETNLGRPLIRSDSVIPTQVRAYDGKRVSVAGFVLPLRTRNRLVTEFLLLRDQGTCCFGPAAQVNHFIRVKVAGKGFTAGEPIPFRVRGRLHVGEAYVEGYLTGIYWMEAEEVQPDTPR